MHADIGHVAAYRPLRLDGDGLDGVRVMVPGVARVSTRRGGRTITGVLGDVTPAQGDADARPARSPAASSPAATSRWRRGRVVGWGRPRSRRSDRGARKPSHEIRIVDGEPTLRRVGFR